MKTPSEVMIECMEDFGNSEPQKVLVIYLDSEDYVKWRSNGLLDHEKIGLMEVTKAALLRGADNPKPLT